jgi:hypothetical protein
MRATDIVIQSERHKFTLNDAGQYRTYWMYIPSSQHVVMTCDTHSVTSSYLRKYCAAFVDIRGVTPLHDNAFRSEQLCYSCR